LLIDYGRFLTEQNRPTEALPFLRLAAETPNVTPDLDVIMAMALLKSGDIKAGCDKATSVKRGVQPAFRKAVDQLLASPLCRDVSPGAAAP
jgi:Tfp pilus assembly protein PilF